MSGPRTVVRKALKPLREPLRDAANWVFGGHHEHLSTAPQTFDDRSRGRGTVLLVLAGYKPELWDHVFPRIAAHVSPDTVDVCVVCSGHPPAAGELREAARRYGWSFSQCAEDRLAHAQNLAIRALPKAEWISKIDEDMFVTAGWLDHLRETHERVEREGKWRVGFVAPVIPINGYGWRLLMELTGTLDEYRAAFPEFPPISAAMDVGAHQSAGVAEWLWRHSTPLDEMAATLARRAGESSICPHRFSIGAFLMKRETWALHGGFKIAGDGELGWEESQLCTWCMDQSRAIVVDHSALVGHFAFYPQWEHMLALLKRDPALFR